MVGWFPSAAAAAAAEGTHRIPQISQCSWPPEASRSPRGAQATNERRGHRHGLAFTVAALSQSRCASGRSHPNWKAPYLTGCSGLSTEHRSMRKRQPATRADVSDGMPGLALNVCHPVAQVLEGCYLLTQAKTIYGRVELHSVTAVHLRPKLPEKLLQLRLLR